MFFFHYFLASSMTNWVNLFTYLLIYGYVEIHWSSENIGLWQLPKVSRAFKREGCCTILPPWLYLLPSMIRNVLSLVYFQPIRHPSGSSPALSDVSLIRLTPQRGGTSESPGYPLYMQHYMEQFRGSPAAMSAMQHARGVSPSSRSYGKLVP